MSSQPSRQDTGRAAERVVVGWLVAHGYDIVGTNVRLGSLEIDIVARSGPVVAVVEVRTRGAKAWTTGFGSVDAKKRRRVRRAGERLWQRRYKHDASVERLRFDAAAVSWGPDGEVAVLYAPAAF